MLRHSRFLAFALGLATIGSAASPAGAFSSPYFGGSNSRMAGQFHPAPSVTSVQQSRQANRIEPTSSLPPKIQVVSAGSPTSSVGTARIPMPKQPAGANTGLNPSSDLGKLAAQQLKTSPGTSGSMKQAEDNCTTNPKLCSLPPCKWPCEPLPHPSGGGNSGGKGSGSGPVVILAPQTPVPVPVAVSIPAPVATPTPVRVATATSSITVVPATSSVVASQCVPGDNTPVLGAGIDQLLPDAQLSATDKAEVTELRQMIQQYSAAGKVGAARNVEEVAMYVLGYQKVWLRCGLGTFDWEQVAAVEAGQPK